MNRLKLISWSSSLGFGRQSDKSLRQSDKSLRKNVDVQKSSEMPQTGMINRGRSGCKVTELTLGIRSGRTPFRTGALMSSLSQMKIKNKMGRRLRRNTWVRGTSRRQRRLEASSEGGQGPEGALEP
jgi:hypothetical protein